ncbi:hypothetical protein DICPUDRAFT_99177 [Dictyostelium purpureum]|uniref:Uncharacterized protein n=1 Tax=Dictyostelium purpureum TaxID=5786 RepID=F0ZWW3_DICPU|nr:uncharacterized protein DICPUDRAFT_99177 [Dictyostelium purpureum]EGC31562.1 hypothetical protein DICPUDRAFT_99177 [Dictyostelium purpureum]|eukprot:XP_003291904.1 hypothetical protein DICPUDRAFT_99177 [Dictyostelium purpureum]
MSLINMSFLNKNSRTINNINNYNIIDAYKLQINKLKKYFSPLTEGSLYSLHVKYGLDLETALKEFCLDIDITIECINNKEVIYTIKTLLLNGYPNSINLIEYSIENIDHAIIFLLNKMVENKPLTKQKKQSLMDFKIYLKNNQINSIIDLVKDAKALFVDSVDLLYLFESYFLYYCLLTNDETTILKNLHKFKSRELLLIFSSFQGIPRYVDFFLKCQDQSKLFNCLNADLRSLEFNKTCLENYLNHVYKSNLTEEQMLMIFKTIIIHQSPEIINHFYIYSENINGKYSHLIKNNFFKMVIYHSDNSYNMEAPSKLDVIISSLLMDKRENKSLALQINNDINELEVTYFRQNSAQFTNNLLYIVSKNKEVSFLIEVIKNVISSSQFFEIDEAINFYKKLDQDLMVSVFKNQKNRFYFKKSSLLVSCLITSMVNNDRKTICNIISSTFSNNIDIEIPGHIYECYHILEFLIANGYLKEFDLEFLITQVIRLDKFNKDQFIEFLSINLKENSNDFSFLKTIIPVIHLDIPTILDKDNNSNNNNNDNDEFLYEDDFYGSEGEDNEDYEDSENEETNTPNFIVGEEDEDSENEETNTQNFIVGEEETNTPNFIVGEEDYINDEPADESVISLYKNMENLKFKK